MDFSKRIVKEMYGVCRDSPAGYSAELSKDPFEDAVDLSISKILEVGNLPIVLIGIFH